MKKEIKKNFKELEIAIKTAYPSDDKYIKNKKYLEPISIPKRCKLIDNLLLF
jgi:hypothetical protein